VNTRSALLFVWKSTWLPSVENMAAPCAAQCFYRTGRFTGSFRKR